MTDPKSNGHSTTLGYFVEVRTIGDLIRPIRLGQTNVTSEWRQVTWDRASLPIGHTGVSVVAPTPMSDPVANQQGVLKYEHALAMAAGASASVLEGFLMIEFRLRKVQLETQWEITDKGVGRVMNFLELERAESYTMEE